MQALVDETHKAGKKAACHVYGGEGQRNAIVAGCDTIEHGFGLDPTLVRYVEPYMDDNDEKNTKGKYRIVPIFERAATMGIKVMLGSGEDGSTYAHGTQALDFEALVPAKPNSGLADTGHRRAVTICCRSLRP